MKIFSPEMINGIDLLERGIADVGPAIKALASAYTSCVLMADTKVFELFGQEVLASLECLGIPLHSHLLPSGEQAKSLDVAHACWSALVRFGTDRKSLVVSLGGGTVSDLAGFVASCYMRGVDVVHIPTTLLAMVDAAIGGKTGVNLPEGKNLVGTFHLPKRVLLCPELLATLPDEELSSGLAEVIKAAVIGDAVFFESLEREIGALLRREPQAVESALRSACAIKNEIVTRDATEQNLRALLNYGHTFAHALETATQYKQYLHGEAVSIGMSCAAYVGEKLGYVDGLFIARQDALCRAAGLPTNLPDIGNDTLISLMKRDKKCVSGKINLIVPEKLGKVIKASDVPIEIIDQALKEKRAKDRH